MRLEVKGAEQLDQIARVLTAKGNPPALKRRMTKSFKQGAEPIKRDQLANLASRLPKSGGAAATIGGETRIGIRTSTARTTVDIVDSWKGHDMQAIDQGTLRHPLFGHRRHWYNTRIPRLLLTKPFLRHRRTVALHLLAEMNRLAEEIARET